MLGMCKALCCGPFKPTDHLQVLLLDTLAEVITRAEVAFGESSVLIVGELKPTDRFRFILLDALAQSLAGTDSTLRTGTVLFGCETFFSYRLSLHIVEGVKGNVIVAYSRKLGADLTQSDGFDI